MSTGLQDSTGGEGKPSPSGPFASAAMELRSHGLVAFPVGGENGKRPLVKAFTTWRGPASIAKLNELIKRFGHTNVGIACGPSQLAVVDIDDPSHITRVIEACGPTPLVVATPSGGRHFYYHDSLRLQDQNLRKAGLAIDIKASGGFVVAPPSRHVTSGALYAFESGSWDDRRSLPTLKPEAIQRLTGVSHAQRSGTSPVALVASVANDVGVRNSNLFTYLRHTAPFSSEVDAVSEAHAYNRTQNMPPLDEVSVVATARQVWAYQRRGTLKSSAGSYVRLQDHELEALSARGGKDYPTALAMLVELRRAHGAGQDAGIPFAVSVEAMARDEVITGVADPARLRRARDVLEDIGLLREVVPSRWNGLARKPALYLLSRLAKPCDVRAESGSDVPSPSSHSCPRNPAPTAALHQEMSENL